MEKSPSNLAPFVYWAQSTSEVTLRVDLKDVKEPHLMVEEEEIEFAAVGVGSHGKQRWVEMRRGGCGLGAIELSQSNFWTQMIQI